MKFKFSYIALFMSSLLLQACGGGGGLAGDEKDSTDPLIPEPVVNDGSDRPRPSESTPFIKADGWLLKDVAGQPIFLRGTNILFGDNPIERIKNITPASEIGSNVVRLQVKKTTRKEELEGALVDIVSKRMIALVTLVDDSLTCKDDEDELDKVVSELWLGSWLEVIAQDRFQPHLMVNVAHQWGPKSVFTENTIGYGDYIEAHKLAIREFRKAGLKIPLVIDAAGCGQDYYSFTAGRARELKAADTQGNLVLSVHGAGEVWSTDDKIRTALTKLAKTNMPIVMSGFAGSNVATKNEVDHLSIMKKGMGDGGLAISIPWQSVEDKAAYSVTLEEQLYLDNGGSIRTDVYVPKSYVSDGKLGIVLYLKDAEGHYANTGWTQANNLLADSWNRINFKLQNIDALKANGAYVEDGFDLGSVRTIGYEIVANNKPITVSGALIFDNLTVFPGVEPVYKGDFNGNASEWDLDWGPLTVGNTNGHLTVLPTGAGDGGVNLQGWKAPSFYLIPLSKPIDVSVKLFVPESYATDSGLGIKIYGKDTNWSWIDGPASSLVDSVGKWTTVKLRVDFSAALKPYNAFGIQFYGLAGAKTDPILIDSVSITDPSKTNTKIINAMQLGTAFDGDAETYDVKWGKKASVAVVDGVLEVTNTNTEGNADVAVGRYDIFGKSLNLSGPVTIKAKVFVPANLAGNSDFYFNFFMQDAGWKHFSFPTMKVEDFVPGEWTEIEILEDTFNEDFNRLGNLREFGFQFGGAGVNATIKIDDIQIWGNVEVEDSQPVLVVDFESQAEVDAFKFDNANGGLSEGVLAAGNAKGWTNSTLPFGWIANSWIGNGGYDMSTSEGAVVLTPRGEEIANGQYGIKMTSIPASFVKP